MGGLSYECSIEFFFQWLCYPSDDDKFNRNDYGCIQVDFMDMTQYSPPFLLLSDKMQELSTRFHSVLSFFKSAFSAMDHLKDYPILILLCKYDFFLENDANIIAKFSTTVNDLILKTSENIDYSTKHLTTISNKILHITNMEPCLALTSVIQLSACEVQKNTSSNPNWKKTDDDGNKSEHSTRQSLSLKEKPIALNAMKNSPPSNDSVPPVIRMNSFRLSVQTPTHSSPESSQLDISSRKISSAHGFTDTLTLEGFRRLSSPTLSDASKKNLQKIQISIRSKNKEETTLFDLPATPVSEADISPRQVTMEALAKLREKHLAREKQGIEDPNDDNFSWDSYTRGNADEPSPEKESVSRRFSSVNRTQNTDKNGNVEQQKNRDDTKTLPNEFYGKSPIKSKGSASKTVTIGNTGTSRYYDPGQENSGTASFSYENSEDISHSNKDPSRANATSAKLSPSKDEQEKSGKSQSEQSEMKQPRPSPRPSPAVISQGSVPRSESRTSEGKESGRLSSFSLKKQNPNDSVNKMSAQESQVAQSGQRSRGSGEPANNAAGSSERSEKLVPTDSAQGVRHASSQDADLESQLRKTKQQLTASPNVKGMNEDAAANKAMNSTDLQNKKDFQSPSKIRKTKQPKGQPDSGKEEEGSYKKADKANIDNKMQKQQSETQPSGENDFVINMSKLMGKKDESTDARNKLSAQSGQSPALQSGLSPASKSGLSPASQSGQSPASQSGQSPASQLGRSRASQSGQSQAEESGRSQSAQAGRSPAAQSAQSGRSPAAQSAQSGRSPAAQSGQSQTAQSGRSPAAQSGQSPAAQSDTKSRDMKESAANQKEGSRDLMAKNQEAQSENKSRSHEAGEMSNQTSEVGQGTNKGDKLASSSASDKLQKSETFDSKSQAKEKQKGRQKKKQEDISEITITPSTASKENRSQQQVGLSKNDKYDQNGKLQQAEQMKDSSSEKKEKAKQSRQDNVIESDAQYSSTQSKMADSKSKKKDDYSSRDNSSERRQQNSIKEGDSKSKDLKQSKSTKKQADDQKFAEDKKLTSLSSSSVASQQDEQRRAEKKQQINKDYSKEYSGLSSHDSQEQSDWYYEDKGAQLSSAKDESKNMKSSELTKEEQAKMKASQEKTIAEQKRAKGLESDSQFSAIHEQKSKWRRTSDDSTEESKTSKSKKNKKDLAESGYRQQQSEGRSRDQNSDEEEESKSKTQKDSKRHQAKKGGKKQRHGGDSETVNSDSDLEELSSRRRRNKNKSKRKKRNYSSSSSSSSSSESSLEKGSTSNDKRSRDGSTDENRKKNKDYDRYSDPRSSKQLRDNQKARGSDESKNDKRKKDKKSPKTKSKNHLKDQHGSDSDGTSNRMKKSNRDYYEKDKKYAQNEYNRPPPQAQSGNLHEQTMKQAYGNYTGYPPSSVNFREMSDKDASDRQDYDKTYRAVYVIPKSRPMSREELENQELRDRERAFRLNKSAESDLYSYRHPYSPPNNMAPMSLADLEDNRDVMETSHMGRNRGQDPNNYFYSMPNSMRSLTIGDLENRKDKSGRGVEYAYKGNKEVINTCPFERERLFHPTPSHQHNLPPFPIGGLSPGLDSHVRPTDLDTLEREWQLFEKYYFSKNTQTPTIPNQITSRLLPNASTCPSCNHHIPRKFEPLNKRLAPMPPMSSHIMSGGGVSGTGVEPLSSAFIDPPAYPEHSRFNFQYYRNLGQSPVDTPHPHTSNFPAYMNRQCNEPCDDTELRLKMIANAEQMIQDARNRGSRMAELSRLKHEEQMVMERQLFEAQNIIDQARCTSCHAHGNTYH